ncbi:hypothetical protein ACFPL7_03220 [Dongia soli]|uniref:Uncharacterized protein n=1 Tax=Dongia soli TaxID=600628 RepID=A0ABU5EEC0_9PROT|nr:hypothetical protein [Dongia soli]MDY0884699.1 hypothetical protein [Dongia soli]
MATEQEAEQARDQHAETLIRCGAHAIGIDRGDLYGEPGYVVICYVAPARLPGAIPGEAPGVLPETKPALLPDRLELQRDGRHISVAVIVKPAEPFRPE